MDKDRLIERLRKIKSLADKGVDGESDSAKMLLERLCDEYGISEETLIENPVRMYSLHGDGDTEFRLLHQICVRYGEDNGVSTSCATPLSAKGKKRILSSLVKSIDGSKKTDNCVVECAAADFVNIAAMFDLYRTALKKDFETFYYAFLLKNDLLSTSKGSDNGKKPTEEEVEMAMKALQMSNSIGRTEYRKQLQGGGR